MASESEVMAALIGAFERGSHHRTREFGDGEFDSAFGELIHRYIGMWEVLQERILEKVELMGSLALAAAGGRPVTREDFVASIRWVCSFEPTWICMELLKIIGEFPRHPAQEWPKP